MQAGGDRGARGAGHLEGGVSGAGGGERRHEGRGEAFPWQSQVVRWLLGLRQCDGSTGAGRSVSMRVQQACRLMHDQWQ